MSNDVQVLHGNLAPVQQMPNAMQMLQGVLSGGVTAENVAAVKELVQLAREESAIQARRDFATAFNALQAEMPAVKACKAVPGRDGSTRYKYAPYEEIMEQVKPMLQKHGFTVRFDSDDTETSVVQTCILQHANGHEERTRFSARKGQGPPNASAAQTDGAASTYAKRFALCNALNIVIEADTDARNEGDTITAEQAADLQRRVRAVKADEFAFLEFAHAASFEAIKTGAYPLLVDMIVKKERQAAKQ